MMGAKKPGFTGSQGRAPMAATAEQASPWLKGRSFPSLKDEFDRSGYLIFERVLAPERVAELRAALAPHLARDLLGRNDFEGTKTNRVYALLAKSPVFAELATHPLAMAFVEAELGDSCLLSAMLAINLHPGETVQPWHFDDGGVKIPRPRPALGISTSGRSTTRPSRTAPPKSFREAICGTANISRARCSLRISPTRPSTMRATGRTPSS
jgi:hypothetical protein